MTIKISPNVLQVRQQSSTQQRTHQRQPGKLGVSARFASVSCAAPRQGIARRASCAWDQLVQRGCLTPRCVAKAHAGASTGLCGGELPNVPALQPRAAQGCAPRPALGNPLHSKSSTASPGTGRLS